MTIRCKAYALVLGAGLLAATNAQAWFSWDERPPPNGSNGLSANGFSVKGFAHEGVTLKGAVLKGGARVVLK